MTKIAFDQLDFVEDALKQMEKDVATYTRQEQTITSLYRIGDKGVHGQLPLRAVDLRCQDPELGNRIARYMNTLWTYDPERPGKVVCIFHDVGQGAHLHLQCHPNTVRNE